MFRIVRWAIREAAVARGGKVWARWRRDAGCRMQNAECSPGRKRPKELLALSTLSWSWRCCKQSRCGPECLCRWEINLNSAKKAFTHCRGTHGTEKVDRMSNTERQLRPSHKGRSRGRQLPPSPIGTDGAAGMGQQAAGLARLPQAEPRPRAWAARPVSTTNLAAFRFLSALGFPSAPAWKTFFLTTHISTTC